MDLRNVLIQTENLILKPIEQKYSEDIFQEFTDEISLYMFPKPKGNIDEIRQSIEVSIEKNHNGSNLQLVAISKKSSEFIGCVDLHSIQKKDPELGLWIKKEAHGNSYGLEAITLLIDWTNKNVEFEYLRYPVDKRNYASRRIAEINKGQIKKEYKDINQRGFELDTVEYWIYKSQSHKAND